MNLYDFVVRKPGKPTEKYGLRAYDEIILAPMASSAWFVRIYLGSLIATVASVCLSHE